MFAFKLVLLKPPTDRTLTEKFPHPITEALEEILREFIPQPLFQILQGLDYYYSCLTVKKVSPL